MMSQQMIHPEKWRETCDPFLLPYRCFRLTEILGYPHARNDVFHAKGICEGKELLVYIKAARPGNRAVANDVAIQSQLNAPCFPKVIDSSDEPTPFSVTAALPGLRLSTIVGANEDMASLSYMEEYGAALAKLHALTPAAPPQADRKFYHRPPDEMLKALRLSHLSGYFAHAPASDQTVFCPGDFHYANVLWEDHRISAILDFELSGYGSRDFDIAWAMFLRPGQYFLKAPEEQLAFLRGYRRWGEYNADAVRYYMAQCYVYFLNFCDDDPEYCAYIRTWLAENCT